MGDLGYERWISRYSSIREDFGGLSQRKSVGRGKHGSYFGAIENICTITSCPADEMKEVKREPNRLDCVGVWKVIHESTRFGRSGLLLNRRRCRIDDVPTGCGQI
jgi:hypothetical protein